AILFPPEYVEAHESALNSEAGLASVMEVPVPVDYLLVRLKDKPLLANALSYRPVGIMDADQYFVLFSRDQIAYPWSTRILRDPHCIGPPQVDRIGSELEAWRAAEQMLPVDLQRLRGLPLTASLLTASFRYLAATSRSDLRSLLSPHLDTHPQVARSIARMALANHDGRSVVELVANLADRSVEDILILALAQHDLGDFSPARQNLAAIVDLLKDPDTRSLARRALAEATPTEEATTKSAWAPLRSRMISSETCGPDGDP
ncbi:MAG: hypothetical protein R3200_15960, partial [Xanthomonadales bacterium]|nr:hypothetical protein [Xanthomonadales bacterium]